MLSVLGCSVCRLLIAVDDALVEPALREVLPTVCALHAPGQGKADDEDEVDFHTQAMMIIPTLLFSQDNTGREDNRLRTV